MEKKLAKLNVKGKIRFSILCIIAVFAFAIVASIIGTFVTNAQFKRFYKESYACSVKQMEIRKDMQYLGKNLMWSITHSDPVQIAERRAMAEEGIKGLEIDIKSMREVYHNTEHLDELDKLWAELMTTHKVLEGYMDANDKKSSILLYVGDYEAIVAKIQNLLIEIGTEAENAATMAFITSKNTGSGSAILLIVLLVVSVAVGLYFVRLLTNQITTPVDEIKHAAEELSKGNLDVDITHTSTDEFGQLADSFRTTCSALKNIIHDLSYVMNELRNGNFDVNSKDASLYVGEFKVLLNEIEEVTRNQSDTLFSINQAVSQVATGAGQLSRSAQDIAEGATNQAGAVGALSVTINEVLSISAGSTERAEGAVETVKQAVVAAEKGKVEVAELIEAMERISETSKQIENIITDIEDIASQTNLLSLNASIEAARAGEAGRGFSVVAEQIGKLAANSAQSAVDTRALIGKALDEIQNGSNIVNNTTEIITQTINDMESFENIANGMVKAFRSQSDMLKQVEADVDRISDVVQSNAAVAEETSAVTEELSAQAVELNDLSGRFTFHR